MTHQCNPLSRACRLTTASLALGAILFLAGCAGRTPQHHVPVDRMIRKDQFYRVAEFVTPSDPAVIALTDSLDPSPTPQHVYLAMRNAGLRYSLNQFDVRDVKDPHGVWFHGLQPPAETLALRAGDCEDLAFVYASALARLGYQSALLAMPGHLIVLVRTDPPAAQQTAATDDDSTSTDDDATADNSDATSTDAAPPDQNVQLEDLTTAIPLSPAQWRRDAARTYRLVPIQMPDGAMTWWLTVDVSQLETNTFDQAHVAGLRWHDNAAHRVAAIIPPLETKP